MVRVIYRWRVEPDRRDGFVQWWHEGTLRIRSSRRGAMGSTLLEPKDDDAHVVAVARWASQEDVEAFWADAAGPGFPGSSLESVELFQELDHLTLEDA
jgi:heme-degrading monooxygenase HmoA